MIKTKKKAKTVPINKAEQYRRTERIERIVICIIMLSLLVALSIKGYMTTKKIKAYQAEITELQQDIKDEELRSGQIEEFKEYTKTDEYAEKIAREKLGLVMEDEIVFKAIEK